MTPPVFFRSYYYALFRLKVKELKFFRSSHFSTTVRYEQEIGLNLVGINPMNLRRNLIILRQDICGPNCD